MGPGADLDPLLVYGRVLALAAPPPAAWLHEPHSRLDAQNEAGALRLLTAAFKTMLARLPAGPSLWIDSERALYTHVLDRLAALLAEQANTN